MKNEDESDSDSSSSSGSSSSDSDSDSESKKHGNVTLFDTIRYCILIHSTEEPRPRKTRSKPSPVNEIKPDIVRRVWKARAKDSEGNPVHHGGAPIAAKAKDAHGNGIEYKNNSGSFYLLT